MDFGGVSIVEVRSLDLCFISQPDLTGTGPGTVRHWHRVGSAARSSYQLGNKTNSIYCHAAQGSDSFKTFNWSIWASTAHLDLIRLSSSRRKILLCKTKSSARSGGWAKVQLWGTNGQHLKFFTLLFLWLKTGTDKTGYLFHAHLQLIRSLQSTLDYKIHTLEFSLGFSPLIRIYTAGLQKRERK